MKIFIKPTALILTLFPYQTTADPITTTDLLTDSFQTDKSGRPIFGATKTVNFSKTSGTASSIAVISLTYFPVTGCTGSSFSTYTTPTSGPSYSISGTFGLVATAVWNVGNVTLGISDMTAINSLAVVFRSTSAYVPQANFTNSSFACISPLTCTSGPSGQCTSSNGTQSFTLSLTAAIGDPAGGGVLACQNTGSGSSLYNMIVPASDNSSSIQWSPSTGNISNTSSTTDGATNSINIVQSQGTSSTYAARTCTELVANGGYDDWYLPAGNSLTSQLSCIFANRTAIKNFTTSTGTQYWSSTQINTTAAAATNFNNGVNNSVTKTSTAPRMRCARTFS